jgi:hypothetical protein
LLRENYSENRKQSVAQSRFGSKEQNVIRKYAPEVPDAKWHRSRDTNYLRELLSVAKLSQRGAAPVLGVDERTMRYKASGERELTYAEQYLLEVLADKMQTGEAMHAVHETATPYEVAVKAKGAWHQISDRPLKKSDAGKIIVGFDKYRRPVLGMLTRDNFGLAIREFPAEGTAETPIERICVYQLLDPPDEELLPPKEDFKW